MAFVTFTLLVFRSLFSLDGGVLDNATIFEEAAASSLQDSPFKILSFDIDGLDNSDGNIVFPSLALFFEPITLLIDGMPPSSSLTPLFEASLLLSLLMAMRSVFNSVEAK